MAKKKRYIVMLEEKTIYRGNQRLLAWLVWFLNRKNKAVAYDCGVWIVEPSYWIKTPLDYNDQKQYKFEGEE